ncbi:MAG TPA: M23 family metallopeptidase [Pyrinomonadaceae bacterium]|jgi:murein DD-endopeptidase MepM/ murein hydrolase activator NlpD|nr:M23 family metallopeptidase [Pyrinomonadaceae bacterium]
MRLIKFSSFLFALLLFQTACGVENDPNKIIPPHLLKFKAGSFAYPIGQTDFVTERRDWDAWYNAQDFGENRHLGEDWNANTGGNSDCGAPVYASADGRISFAGDAGAGWGNVVIIEHVAPDGTTIQTLYGHLETILKTSGEAKRREQIGTVGGANGRYPCHLHFEMRWTACPVWNKTGNGYGDDKTGWIDPSEFIEKTR